MSEDVGMRRRGLSVLQRVATAATSTGTVQGSYKAEDLYTVSIFGRARDELVGSAVLMEQGRVLRAFILQRSLFEDSLFTTELCACSPNDRLQIVASWLERTMSGTKLSRLLAVDYSRHDEDADGSARAGSCPSVCVEHHVI